MSEKRFVIPTPLNAKYFVSMLIAFVGNSARLYGTCLSNHPINFHSSAALSIAECLHDDKAVNLFELCA